VLLILDVIIRSKKLINYILYEGLYIQMPEIGYQFLATISFFILIVWSIKVIMLELKQYDQFLLLRKFAISMLTLSVSVSLLNLLFMILISLLFNDFVLNSYYPLFTVVINFTIALPYYYSIQFALNLRTK